MVSERGLFKGAKRIAGILVDPKSTLKQIALDPDFTGPVLIVAGVLSANIALANVATSKLVFTGEDASSLFRTFEVAVIDTVTISSFGIVFAWIGGGVFLWWFTGRDRWERGLSASLSLLGYSLLITLLTSVANVVMLSFLVATLVLDSSLSSQAIMQRLTEWRQMLAYGPFIPLGIMLYWIQVLLIAVIYGTGANYGTDGKAGETAFYTILLFGLLGFISLLVSFAGL